MWPFETGRVEPDSGLEQKNALFFVAMESDQVRFVVDVIDLVDAHPHKSRMVSKNEIIIEANVKRKKCPTFANQ